MSKDDLDRVALQAERLPDCAMADVALRETLAHVGRTYDLRFLLAHHDDGVVWGCWDGQAWRFSSDSFGGRVSPPFRAQTLQQARAFGPTAEVLLWRAAGGLKASVLREGEGDARPYFDRPQLLWGDQMDDADAANGFTLLREGRQGLRHAVPLVGFRPRPHLTVRHYVDYETQSQQAYVRWSRLVNLAGEGGDDGPQA